jgi:uncharacterized membrane protein
MILKYPSNLQVFHHYSLYFSQIERREKESQEIEKTFQLLKNHDSRKMERYLLFTYQQILQLFHEEQHFTLVAHQTDNYILHVGF